MVPGRGRYARGLVAAAFIAGAAALLRGAAPAPVEAAQSGLSYTSVATWTVDPTLGSVHVDLEISATSNTVDSGDRRYYFPGLQLTLPLSTANYFAFDDQGQSLPMSVTADEPSGVVVYVPFRQRLYSGQSVSFELKFDLVDMWLHGSGPSYRPGHRLLPSFGFRQRGHAGQLGHRHIPRRLHRPGAVR